MTTLCAVYRSGKRAEAYVYLARGKEFDELPAELRATFGAPVFVMNLQLRPERPLARVPVESVIEALENQGYFLQLPPELPVEEEIARRFS